MPETIPNPKVDHERLVILADDRRMSTSHTLAQFAHELQQPLTAITGALSIMRARYDRMKGERARQIVERQVTQIRHLITDLLDATRMERGVIACRVEEIDLGQTVGEVLEAFRPQLDSDQHQLTYAAPEKPVRIRADGARMQQIVSNLVGNAAKFTPAGGKIEVRVLVDDDQAALLIVRDNGRGITPESLDDVFNLFTRDDRMPGDGIGLYVVRRLVELHGGTVEARSEGTGRGAEFIVRLPLAETAATSAA
jgi:signal transduction histidine kinase